MSINNNEEAFLLRLTDSIIDFAITKSGELVELITISALVKRVGNDSRYYNLRRAFVTFIRISFSSINDSNIINTRT